jgi:hypothetical protein
LGEEVLCALPAAEADVPISMVNLGEPMAVSNGCLAHKTLIICGLADFGTADHFQLETHGLAFMARKLWLATSPLICIGQPAASFCGTSRRVPMALLAPST